MSTYYISNSGCDLLDGLSPNSAFQTINKLNKVIKGGDTVLFRCGDTFYGAIDAPAGLSRENPTTFSSFGEGKKPIITQYKLIHKDAWKLHNEGIWKIDLYDIKNYDGNIFDKDANVGFLLVDDDVKGYKKFDLFKLQNQWDFLSDIESGILYVKSEKNPGELSDDIRVACNIRSIFFTDNLKVQGLTFTGTGAHAIAATVKGGYVGDCEFYNLGGSHLTGYKAANTRYGNGVECWSESSDVIVENCKFWGIYDVALTLQGSKSKKPWKNIHFRNNEIWNNNQSFEIWSRPFSPEIGFENCSFENNVCINAGYCWSNDPRPDKKTAAHLLIYSVESNVCDITIKNNYFYGAMDSMIFKSGGASSFPKDYKIVDNTFVILNGKSIIFKYNDDVKNQEFTDEIIKNNTVIYLNEGNK